MYHWFDFEVVGEITLKLLIGKYNSRIPLRVKACYEFEERSYGPSMLFQSCYPRRIMASLADNSNDSNKHGMTPISDNRQQERHTASNC